jgi:hypothetical protein
MTLEPMAFFYIYNFRKYVFVCYNLELWWRSFLYGLIDEKLRDKSNLMFSLKRCLKTSPRTVKNRLWVYENHVLQGLYRDSGKKNRLMRMLFNRNTSTDSNIRMWVSVFWMLARVYMRRSNILRMSLRPEGSTSTLYIQPYVQTFFKRYCEQKVLWNT